MFLLSAHRKNESNGYKYFWGGVYLIRISALHIFVVLVFISLLSIFSCSSPSKDDVPSSEMGTEKKVIPKDDYSENIKSQSKEEISQNTAPVVIQSSLTPISEQEKIKGTIGENTSEVAVQVSKEQQLEKQGEELDGEHEDINNTVGDNGLGNEEKSDPFNQIQVGMPFEEVVKFIGKPDVLISQNSSGKMSLYRWNREGKSLYARFEDGILKRCSRKGEESKGEIAPLTKELYDQLKEGMELEDVIALLQRPGVKVSSDTSGEAIYLWTDKKGSSFSARFTDNKLVRKSGFYVRPISPSQTQGEVEEEVPQSSEEEPPGNTLNEEVYEETDTNEESLNEGYNVNEVDKQSTNQSSNQDTSPNIPQPLMQDEKRVVAQSNRRIIYAGERSKVPSKMESTSVMKQKLKRQRVRLPDYTYQIREGAYEVKITNPLDTSVKVAIRSGKRGKNVTIPPQGTKSIKVPRGDYQIFYIRDDDPTTIQQGGTIQIDGLFIADIEMLLLR